MQAARRGSRAVSASSCRWRSLPACLGVALIAACATRPPAPVPEARVEAPAPPAGGRVLGRSERFVIYQPAPGDTLRSIAASFLGSESRDWVIAEFNGLGPAAQAEPERPLAIPLKPINPTGTYADQYQTVPILCYHRFAAGNGNGGGKMVISAANFAAQLDWLARNDYRVIPLAQLTAFLQGKQALPKRAVVITIDDGYESVHRVALPLLRKYGFPATLFAYTDFIGAADALSWAQLQDLAASGLVDVQAHSKSHRNLIERAAGDTDERYRQMLDAETRAPRELLERKLGLPVRAYAYPYGDANQAVLDALARQRYQLGVTVNPGGNGFFAQPLMLRRTMIYGDLDLAAFKLKLQTVRGVAAP
jgi:peptidoglycan/xylan/chitin deacetylase (PgdA/CDA1 family)